jgi:hypothetical protein
MYFGGICVYSYANLVQYINVEEENIQRISLKTIFWIGAIVLLNISVFFVLLLL